MKRKCLVFVLILGGCMLFVPFGCQQQNPTARESLVPTEKPPIQVENEPEAVKASPKITFDKMLLDFGEVGPNTQKTGEILFTNKGDGPLTIIKIPSCCGVHTHLDKMVYAPGESGTIQVEWTSGTRPDVFSRTMVVHSNDPVEPAVTLTVRAKIVQRVVCEPQRLKLVFDEDNAGCPEISIRSLNDEPFSIKGFKSTADCITADFDPNVEATKFILQPKVNSAKLQENLKGRISIDLTHPEGNTATILFDVLPRYQLSPPLIIVFDTEPEKPTMKTISVLNNYKQEFEIESVSSSKGVVGVKVLEKKKITRGYLLDLEITPPAKGDGIKFSDKFEINLKGGEMLSITCNGYFTKRKPTLSKK
ncbi:MAG: DUF1573 domain-containing protein [Sedimentisphaerales bacterium]|nr:DUF1573 domain-containing protein [Sedimentisphaerales bacterium]